MTSSIDWKALDAVYAKSVPAPSPAPCENAVAGHSLETQTEMAEEHAGILEYDWGWPRAKAEACAFRNIK